MPSLDTLAHFSLIIIRQRVLRVSRDMVVPAALSGWMESPAADPLLEQVQTCGNRLGGDPAGNFSALCCTPPLTLPASSAGNCPFSTRPHWFQESQTLQDSGVQCKCVFNETFYLSCEILFPAHSRQGNFLLKTTQKLLLKLQNYLW